MSGAGTDLLRVLIASRGTLARRLLRGYRARGIETVAPFSEADAEAPYVEEADYDAFLGSGPAERVWSDPVRIVEAAMDAGCDAIHPGRGLAARSVALYSAAAAANLLVIGLDPRRSTEVLDLGRLFSRARSLGLSVPPVEVVLPQDDGIAAAARVGLPLRAIPAQGGVVGGCVEGWIDDFGVLAERLAGARGDGEHAVLLMHGGRRPGIEVVVVGDREGVVALGTIGSRGAISTCPASGGSALVEPAVALAQKVGLSGVGSVRFELAADGSAWWSGLYPHLPAASALIEAVYGVDLVEVELAIATGGRAVGLRAGEPPQHGAAARISLSDPSGGRVSRVILPEGEGVFASAAVEAGSELGEGFEPVLAEICCVAPGGDEARSALASALARSKLEGIPTDLEQLAAHLGTKG